MPYYLYGRAVEGEQISKRSIGVIIPLHDFGDSSKGVMTCAVKSAIRILNPREG